MYGKHSIRNSKTQKKKKKKKIEKKKKKKKIENKKIANVYNFNKLIYLALTI